MDDVADDVVGGGMGGGPGEGGPRVRRRAGRRPGPSRTRETILHAARGEFAERGFDAATVREIAGRAGVDPAMITHHFGSKQRLFLAMLDLPIDPGVEIAGVLAGAGDDVAEPLLHRLLEVWDSPAGAASIAVIRTAVQRDWSASLVREFAVSRALTPLMAVIVGAAEEKMWRANLAATQVVGLMFARYVVRLEPLASADHGQVVAAIAPTLQRYLTGPVEQPAGT